MQFKNQVHWITFVASTVNHNYDHDQRTLKHENSQNELKHLSHITNHGLFDFNSMTHTSLAKLIDDSRERKR